MKDLKFQKHRNYNKSYKMLFRFALYAVVFGVLSYLIWSRGKDAVQNVPVNNSVNDFVIDTL